MQIETREAIFAERSTPINSHILKSEALSTTGVHVLGGNDSAISVRGLKRRPAGLTLVELLVVMAIGMILALMAVPVFNSAMTTMRMNSVSNNISAAIGKTRYRAIMNSQIYTLTLTTPANTYVVTNVPTGVADKPVPLPTRLVAINGGGNATYTFTFCPNGTVYGAGGVCPAANLTPALTLTYQSRQTNMSVTSVGNVTSATIH